MPLTRAEKLVALREFADLQTGRINESAFAYENNLYTKAVAIKRLNKRIAACDQCDELNIPHCTDSAPGWGDLNAKVLFVGQSLHKAGIVSGLPFILASGYMLDAALRLSGLLRKDVFITNVLHCHPPGNRASTEDEKKNCRSFLQAEIDIVQPKLIVALGNDAKCAVPALMLKPPKEQRVVYVKHPASFMYVAPERRIEWILKLSKEIDKVYKAPAASKTSRQMSSGEQGFAGGGLPAYENLPPNPETGKGLIKSLGKLKNNKYRTIYMDPPWPEIGGGKIRRGADKHYSLMTLFEIEEYGYVVNAVADDSCHLYLWTTNNYLPAALNMLSKWRWKYITMITWLKDRKGLGQYYRGKTEHCLFARKGVLPYRKIKGKRAQGVTGFVEARTKHSRKPATMREMIELVSYSPRLEMFAREQHKGWDVWGNEV